MFSPFVRQVCAASFPFLSYSWRVSSLALLRSRGVLRGPGGMGSPSVERGGVLRGSARRPHLPGSCFSQVSSSAGQQVEAITTVTTPVPYGPDQAARAAPPPLKPYGPDRAAPPPLKGDGGGSWISKRILKRTPPLPPHLARHHHHHRHHARPVRSGSGGAAWAGG